MIDTCSILEVRRGLIPGPEIPRVYAQLTEIVNDGNLIFPKQVVDELEECTGSTTAKPDQPYIWAKKNSDQATRFGFDGNNLKAVLAHPIAQKVLDTAKSGKEEADAYILELATRLQRDRHQVTVLTEDRKNKPMKLSLHSACGVLRVVPLNIEVFLAQRGIWTRPL
jgi:hypothetical protein